MVRSQSLLVLVKETIVGLVEEAAGIEDIETSQQYTNLVASYC